MPVAGVIVMRMVMMEMAMMRMTMAMMLLAHVARFVAPGRVFIPGFGKSPRPRQVVR